MLRLYQTVIAYRSVLKAIVIAAAIAAMTLGILADGDGWDI